MAVLPQKNYNFGCTPAHVPKIANYGQKSCLTWFYTYIRGFNRFLVPNNIEKDTLHGCIAPKQKIYNFRCTACAKKGQKRPQIMFGMVLGLY